MVVFTCFGPVFICLKWDFLYYPVSVLLVYVYLNLFRFQYMARNINFGRKLNFEQLWKNTIQFRLAICGSMQTELLLDNLPISQHHGDLRYWQGICNFGFRADRTIFWLIFEFPN